jgi:hypothetical protein
MSAPRYSGTLAVWIEGEGFGEIQPDGSLGRQIVRREALRMAGIEPVIGTALSFEISAEGATTGAVNLEAPHTAAADGPQRGATPAPATVREARLRAYRGAAAGEGR